MKNPKFQNDFYNKKFDAVIIGAGFSGIYMLYKLKKLGLSACIIESGSDVGGTWYWNRYPGARCDTWSMEYSYQFSETLQQEWEWSEKYASQPEILKYAQHVVDRFNLKTHIFFNKKVTSVVFNENLQNWNINTDTNDSFISDFCIMATGCLSEINAPKFQGFDLFQGEIYHTGKWPKYNVIFKNKKIGIIGTGSSAIQAIPIIANEAKKLFVFQRTPNYTIPAYNTTLDSKLVETIKSDYKELRQKAKMTRGGTAIFKLNEEDAFDVTTEERQREYESRWQTGGGGFIGAYQDLLTNEKANKTASNFVRSKIFEIVDDKKTAELLSPTNIIGCKRLCVDTDYYKTFNKPNVNLVDVNKNTIESITPNGIKIKNQSFDLDMIIFATGFDAMTGALLNIDIQGKNQISLSSKWKNGPRMYLGLQIEGFPNLFTITGPGSPSVLSNMIVSIEQHVEWISDCIKYMNKNNLKQIEAELEAENQWVDHVNEVASKSLRSTCNSWYIGANVPGKPRVFMPYIGGVPTYKKICDEIVDNGYQGFRFS